METKVYEYNNIKYRVSANKDVHTRLSTDEAFASTFFQQRTTKHATFIGSTPAEEESTPPQDHQEYTSDQGGFTKYKWTPEMTRRLISLYKERKEKMSDKNKKKPLFSEITLALKSEGYDVDFYDVDRKWRNMKGSFFQILSNNKGENTRWPYFNEVYPLFINEAEENQFVYPGRSRDDGPSGCNDVEERVTSKFKSNRDPKVIEAKKLRRHPLYKTSRLQSRLTTTDQVLLKLKMIHRHKLNLLKLQAKRNKYLKVISEEMKKSNEESKRKNDLMKKFLNLYLSTCVFT